MSDSKTAGTANIKDTPPQNPRVGSVGTLVCVSPRPSARSFQADARTFLARSISYTPGSSNTSANSLVCADVVVVDSYSFPDNVTKDSCRPLQQAAAVGSNEGSSSAWTLQAGGLFGAAAAVVGLAVLV